MKIGFLVLREPVLKTMGSLIMASRNRGHEVTLFYVPSGVGGSKAYQQVTPGKLEVFNDTDIRAEEISLNNLSSLHEKYELDALVTNEGYYALQGELDELRQLRESGTAVVSLSHFYEISQSPLEALTYFDKTYYLSEFGLDMHLDLWRGPETRADLKERYFRQVEVVGSPMFDQLRGLDKDQIRRELKIPAERKIVVLFAPVISSITPWRFFVWNEKNRLKRLWRVIKAGKSEFLGESLTTPSFEEIAFAVRRFCDENDAFLIVKTRQKQGSLEYLMDLADLYVSGEDEKYFPLFESYKLLSVADLCIAVMSMAVVEAVAAGVPVVNIYVPHLDLHGLSTDSKQAGYLNAVMNVGEVGPFNFPGCVRSVDRNSIIGWLKEKRLSDLIADPAAVREFQERFLGMSDLSSSERILNSIEGMLDKKARKVIAVK